MSANSVRAPKNRLLKARRDAEAALTAAGYKIKQRDADAMRRLIQPWQGRAFSYYDIVPEIKYAAQFYSRSLSALRLYVGEMNSDGEIEETENEDAKAYLERIKDPGGGGRTGLLSSYGRLKFLVGEALLFVSLDPDTEMEQWEMLSSDELRVTGAGYQRFKAPSIAFEDYTEASDDDFEPINDDTAVAYRLWTRHPRFSMLADSTMQGVLEICEELVLLTQAVRSRARSRLAGSGILFLSDVLFPAPPDVDASEEDPEEDPFFSDLTEAMTSAIVDEGSASAFVPHTVRVSMPETGRLSDFIYHLQIIDPMQLYPETGLRYECIKRIAIGLDMPPEILLGVMDANHWCQAEDVEILTRDRGWVRHDELAEGDLVRAVDHGSGLAEWQPVVSIYRADVVDEPMVRLTGRFHDSLSTPNHRWPVFRGGERYWTTSEELRPSDQIVRAAPAADVPTEATYDDAFVELVAWFVTEGTCTWPSERHCQVRIAQSHKANPANVSRIRRVLTDLYGEARADLRDGPRVSRVATVAAAWREDAEPRGMTLFHLNKSAYEPLLDAMESRRSKVVSRDFVYSLTAAQLELFLRTVALGDGLVLRAGGINVNQRDARMLAPVELAAILAGRAVQTTSRETGGFAPALQSFLSVHIRDRVKVGKAAKVEKYTGVVWCPVTPSHTWLARRDGKVFFTGNTGWLIDEQTWKHHLQPQADGLVGDLTSAYLLPSMRRDGFPDYERYCIAYDATAIINHPDRAKDAKDLHDREVISNEALLDATGFDATDAPSDLERLQRVGVKIRDAGMAAYGIPTLRQGSELEPAAGEIEAPPMPGGGTEAPPAGAKQPSDVVKTPPAEAPPQESVIGGLNGHGHELSAAMILGAAEMGLLRAREVAGARIRNLAKRNPDVLALLNGVRTGDVAATLGPEALAELKVPSVDELVRHAHDLIVDAFRVFGVPNDTAEKLAETVERHAARTMFERRATLPSQFANFVRGLVSVAPLPED